MTDEIDGTAAGLGRGADLDAAEQLGRELAGLLWSRQQSATDADEQARWEAERLDVRDGRRHLVAGDPDLVRTTLEQWGARVQELRG